MSVSAVLFLIAASAALLVVPRRTAPLPLTVGVCYMTLAQGINIGPLSFPVIRLLIAVGVLRAIMRGERLPGGLNSLDVVLIAWGLCACATSVFHADSIFSFGLVYNVW